jgi:hypothetical protein
MHQDLGRREWPTSAVVTVALLSCVLLTVGFLWARWQDIWGGLDPDWVGSLAEWASGLGTVLAIVFAYRQFSSGQRSARDAEHRAEALKVTAWATWNDVSTDGVARKYAIDRLPVRRWWSRLRPLDARTVNVFNGANGTVFDWNVLIIPSRGWDTYIRLSARAGPLHPGFRQSIRLSTPPSVAEVQHVHSEGSRDEPGPPRFVVLSFNDAWGNGWVRTNGDLQPIPAESRFLPLLLHLRNPAMPWAGLIDDATWKAFHEAAGSPATIPPDLAALLPHSERPWLTRDRTRKIKNDVGRQTLRRRGQMSYTYSPRAIQRRVKRASAFDKVQQFFEEVTRAEQFEVLYVKGG